MKLVYSINVGKNVRENRREAVKFITDYFEDMLGDDGFLKWFANGNGYKPIRLKQLLMENKPNKRNSKFTPANFQEIYDFWLRNCVNSNESAYNLKRITKRSVLEQFTNITGPNLMEKRVPLKSGSKVIFTAPRMVYTESVRKLHVSFNEMHTPVSLSLFFRYKPYYCVRPTEKLSMYELS